MLASMSVRQYQEWLHFFQIRECKLNQETKTRRRDDSREAVTRLGSSIMEQLRGYQERRNKRRGE